MAGFFLITIMLFWVSLETQADDRNGGEETGGGHRSVLVENISLDFSHELASLAMEACRGHGRKVSVVVIDRSATTKSLLTEDDAIIYAQEHAFKKAYTALATRAPSEEFGGRVGESLSNIGGAFLENMTTIAGGLPIVSDHHVIGAIGISGSRTGADDRECASRGLEQAGMSLEL